MSEHAHTHHITPIKTLAATFVTLIVLMAATIAAAYLPEFLPATLKESAAMSLANNVIAMTIACLKAFFVIQIFMGVKYGTKLIKLYAWTGFVWFSLMFIILLDYGTRRWEPVTGWDMKGVHGKAMSGMPVPPADSRPR